MLVSWIGAVRPDRMEPSTTMEFDLAANGSFGYSSSSRPLLPDWPRLMPLRYAAAYFGICPATFRALDIKPRRFGRRVVWDRQDLDRYADLLGGRPQEGRSAATTAREVERRFLERRRRNGNRTT